MQSLPPILLGGRGEDRRYSSRVLSPSEYLQLRTVADLWGRTGMDALLYTGMRYREMKRLHDHPEWLELGRRCVSLPPTATKTGLQEETQKTQGKTARKARTQLGRWVMLNDSGIKAVQTFLQGRQLPSDETFQRHIRDWALTTGLDPAGLSVKTMRKTWESWLVVTYPNRFAQILASQGHNAATSINHYLGLPFLPQDKEEMKPFVDGVF